MGKLEQQPYKLSEDPKILTLAAITALSSTTAATIGFSVLMNGEKPIPANTVVEAYQASNVLNSGKCQQQLPNGMQTLSTDSEGNLILTINTDIANSTVRQTQPFDNSPEVLHNNTKDRETPPPTEQELIESYQKVINQLASGRTKMHVCQD